MTNSIIVKPAYGRSYPNKSLAVQDWRAGMDFFILNENGRPMSTYCSNRDFEAGTSVEIRYGKNLEKLVIIKN